MLLVKDYEQSKTLYPDIDIFVRDLTLDKVKPIDSDSMSPYVTVSFDIEVTFIGHSSQPTKDSDASAIDIYDATLNLYEKSAGDLDTFDNST